MAHHDDMSIALTLLARVLQLLDQTQGSFRLQE